MKCEECRLEESCKKNDTQIANCEPNLSVPGYYEVRNISYRCTHPDIAFRLNEDFDREIYCGELKSFELEDDVPCYTSGNCDYCKVVD